MQDHVMAFIGPSEVVYGILTTAVVTLQSDCSLKEGGKEGMLPHYSLKTTKQSDCGTTGQLSVLLRFTCHERKKVW